MSVTVVREKGVTVVTVASDSNSVLPPLCQILRSLCYSPVCCTVHKGLMQSSAISALGAVQIMVGLFSIGLGAGRTSHHPNDFTDLKAAYWLGGVLIAAGIVSVLADQFPSLILVGFAVLVNIVGAILSAAGIALYAMDLSESNIIRMCDWLSRDIPSSDDNCRYVAYVLQRLLTAMDVTMIVFTVLQLCICISIAALGISALRNKKKDKGDRADDQEVLIKKNPDV